jgi:ankyrin repeat protein
VAIGGTRTITIHSCTADGTISGKIQSYFGGEDTINVTSINATGCTGIPYFGEYNEPVLTNVNVSGCTLLATALIFSNPNLTSINFAGCTSLDYAALNGNGLTSADFTGLNLLKTISVSFNNMNAAALNALFNTLNSAVLGTKLINIAGNPGTATCNKALATAKGWEVAT